MNDSSLLSFELLARDRERAIHLYLGLNVGISFECACARTPLSASLPRAFIASTLRVALAVAERI